MGICFFSFNGYQILPWGHCVAETRLTQLLTLLQELLSNLGEEQQGQQL